MINACKTTKIYCRPNCPPGRRTKLQNQVHFETIDAARTAGYRACKVCLPDDGEYGPWVSKRERVTAELSAQRNPAHPEPFGCAQSLS